MLTQRARAKSIGECPPTYENYFKYVLIALKGSFRRTGVKRISLGCFLHMQKMQPVRKLSTLVHFYAVEFNLKSSLNEIYTVLLKNCCFYCITKQLNQIYAFFVPKFSHLLKNDVTFLLITIGIIFSPMPSGQGRLREVIGSKPFFFFPISFTEAVVYCIELIYKRTFATTSNVTGT